MKHIKSSTENFTDALNRLHHVGQQLSSMSSADPFIPDPSPSNPASGTELKHAHQELLKAIESNHIEKVPEMAQKLGELTGNSFR